MNNGTIDYTLICNDKQEIVLNKNCHHLLHELSLWGRDFVSAVRIIEVIFIKNAWAFSRDQVNCPYYMREVSARKQCR